MGPLFSIALLGMLAGISTVISFAVAKVFLPLKPAAISAVLFVGFGGIGSLLGLFIPALWLPPSLESSEAVLTYLGVSAATGLLSGAIAVRLFLTRRRSDRIPS